VSRIIVGPFNRVEGDLEVKLDIEDGEVSAAYVVASLYRGFEQILEGKPPTDALVFAPRICGICSISQSVASASALRDLMGIEQAENGRLATNLLAATENLADHLTHFYLFFMPDFAREDYGDKGWSDEEVRRFKATKGEAAGAFLAARQRLLHVIGIIAGKWPHTLAIQPGGTTKTLDQGDRVRLISALSDTRRFMEAHVFGASLDEVIELADKNQLEAWAHEQSPEVGDFKFFVRLAKDLALNELGQSPGRCLSYGAYLDGAGDQLFPQSDFDSSRIIEDLTFARMFGENAHPLEGETVPDIDKADAYSWCKAPRLDGQAMEVGAFARQTISGQPLIGSLAQSNVYSRVVARLIEAARLVLAMETWVDQFKLKEPFCLQGEIPDEGTGIGMTEAARGSLGHWMTVKEGRIENYQIISPTTWNFSPRDGEGMPGALEQALAGTPVKGGEKNPVSVQHIVRSFDPCMVCTVH